MSTAALAAPAPPDPTQRLLAEVFGHGEFRPHQREIIDVLMSGDDALVVMPTGGGKSLCFQLPALLRAGCAIVVSPLVALMEDQVGALRQFGVNAACLHSALTTAERNAIERDFASGTLDLLYVAPERLLTAPCLALLQHTELALFAIDEAHCVSRWGHDFRPEYLELAVLRQHFPGVPCIALTATADPRTRDEIVDALALNAPQRFVASFDRPNLHYAIHSDGGRDALWHFISSRHPNGAGIVYCPTRRKVEETADWLTARGRRALPYHAGMEPDVRREHQRIFQHEADAVIVATIAFGMGIDKPDVRFVAHLGLPSSIEAYYQETGRAGRDGEPADAWLSYGLRDVTRFRQWIEESTLADERKRIERQKLEAILGLCESGQCRRRALLNYFGEQRNKDCGNCDNCVNPPALIDGTELAQKALSCIYRTGQRFGVNYLIDVLRGRDSERLQRFGHHRLSTFGIGSAVTMVEWRSVYRQLLVAGLATVEGEHGGLRLTAESRAVLRGERNIELRRAPPTPVRSSTPRTFKPREPLEPARQADFERLRARRLELAREQGVPPYIIFHDSTLTEIARQRPGSLAELADIPGIGKNKLERYGDIFLATLAAD